MKAWSITPSRIAPLAAAAVLCSCLCFASPARADTLVPGRGIGQITRIGKGIFELGLENILLVTYTSTTTPGVSGGADTTVKELGALWAGGPTLRYFLIDNLSLALNISPFVRKTSVETETGNTSTESDSTEFGVMGTLMVGYHLRLGGGMFFQPTIGGGGFWGKLEEPGTGNTVIRKTQFGGIFRVGLNLVYYASRRFNLRAGVDIVTSFGKQDVENQQDDNSLTRVDAGFNVGFNYIF